MKKAINLLLRIGVTGGLLIFLFHRIDLRAIFGTISKLNFKLFLFAFFLTLLCHLLCIFRWNFLLLAQKIKLNFSRVSGSYLIGIFFNLFLPTVGGDVVRSLDLFFHTKKGAQVVASVVVDRLSGLWGIIIILIFVLIFGYIYINEPIVLTLFSLFLVGSAFVLFLLFYRPLKGRFNPLILKIKLWKIEERISKLYKSIYQFRETPKALFKSISISILSQLIGIVVFYYLALSLGATVRLLDFFILIPIVTAISLIPISMGGLGLRDAACVILFGKVGMSSHQAFSMSLIWFFFVVIVGLVGGIFYLLVKKR